MEANADTADGESERLLWAERVGDDEVVLHAKGEAISGLLSIFLNSKFGYHPRWEFLLSPWANGPIDVLVEALRDSGRRPEGRLDYRECLPSPELQDAIEEVKRYIATHQTEQSLQDLVQLALKPHEKALHTLKL